MFLKVGIEWAVMKTKSVLRGISTSNSNTAVKHYLLLSQEKKNMLRSLQTADSAFFGDKHLKQVCFPFSVQCVIMSELKKAFLSDNLAGV